MMKTSNIVHYLRDSARRSPDRLALIMPKKNGEERCTFAELWERIDRFSTALKAKGCQPGERLILMIPMSVDLYVVMLGIIKMGAVAVFVDPWVGIRRINAFAAFAEPIGCVAQTKAHLLRLFSRRLRNLPITISTRSRPWPLTARDSLPSMLSRLSGDGEIFDPEPDTTALITFTSGSGGIPKGADRSHHFLKSQYLALKREFPVRDSDIDMPMFPIFALANLASGVTSVIPKMDFRQVSRVEADKIIQQQHRHRVTTCTASPPFFDRIAADVIEGKAEAPCMRRILTGGGPVTEEQLRRWVSAFPDTRIEIVYGSTEAEPVAHISARLRLEISGDTKGMERGYCVGVPVLSTRLIAIRKEGIPSPPDWEALAVGMDGIGELLVSGDHVCRGYFRNPAATAEHKLIENEGTVWHRMGDTGYFDSEGRFRLVGCVHSTIVRAGEFHHAQLIEELAHRMVSGVQQAAAIGIPDAKLGERLVLVIRTENHTIRPEELRENLCSKGIPIDEVILTTSPLPVDPRHNTKINSAELRRMVLRRKLRT